MPCLVANEIRVPVASTGAARRAEETVLDVETVPLVEEELREALRLGPEYPEAQFVEDRFDLTAYKGRAILLRRLLLRAPGGGITMLLGGYAAITRDSTEQGPAMTAMPRPPTRMPPTSMTVSSSFTSRDTSLKGCETRITSRTPGMASNWAPSRLPLFPVMPMAVPRSASGGSSSVVGTGPVWPPLLTTSIPT